MSWDGAGQIRLETVSLLAADYGYEYDHNSRDIIRTIENCYRRAQNG